MKMQKIPKKEYWFILYFTLELFPHLYIHIIVIFVEYLDLFSIQQEVGSQEFEFLTKIIDKFPEVTEPGTATEIEPFAMGDVFDDDDSANFFVYQGSLTHPPCYESVVWVVSDRIIPATLGQVNFIVLNFWYPWKLCNIIEYWYFHSCLRFKN